MKGEYIRNTISLSETSVLMCESSLNSHPYILHLNYRFRIQLSPAVLLLSKWDRTGINKLIFVRLSRSIGREGLDKEAEI